MAVADDRPSDERPEWPERAVEPGYTVDDEQAIDEERTAGEDQPSTALPPKVERWRRRSAAGALMTGFALGLQQVFEPERKEPSIMLETSGDPPRDLPVDAELDGLGPRHSVVRIRPWLLEQSDSGEEPQGSGSSPRDGQQGSAGDRGRSGTQGAASS